jgi:biopolymer transport protein ExbB
MLCASSIEHFAVERARTGMDIVTQSKSLMLTMGAAPVMWLMIGLSLVSLSIIVERAWFFFSISGDFAALAREFSERLALHDLAGARGVLLASPSSEAQVVLAGLDASEGGVGAARAAMAGAVAVQRTRLDRRLSFLGTLGNNAPFLGLFGTVIGIILAFDELGRAGANATASAGVMDSIAEALVATAIGLLVAIPAVAAFNAFQRKLRSIAANTEALSHVLLTHLESTAQSTAAEAWSVQPSRRPSSQGLNLCSEGV